MITHVPSNQVLSSTVTLSTTCPPASPDPVSLSPNQQPRDGPFPSSLFSLPSHLSISCVRVFTLQHVPKGACDTWSGLVTTELNSNSWCKFMMLAKWILINPSGRHFSWEDTLRIVKDRAKHWSEGDFTGLWAEVIAEESKASHKLRKTNFSTNSLRSNNACRACWAVQDAHFSKAIQALSSNSLARLPLNYEMNSL